MRSLTCVLASAATLIFAAPASAAAPTVYGGTTTVGQDGKVGISVRCVAASPCKGSMRLTTVVKKKTVALGSTTFSVPAGDLDNVVLTLSKSARKLVPATGSLSTLATATSGSSVKKGKVKLVRRASADPCVLITPQEVEQIVGQSVTKGSPGDVGNNTRQCIFRSTPAVTFILQLQVGPLAKGSFENGREQLAPVTALTGLGDAAFQVDATGALNILQGVDYLVLQPPGTAAAKRDLAALRTVASAVLKRLRY